MKTSLPTQSEFKTSTSQPIEASNSESFGASQDSPLNSISEAATPSLKVESATTQTFSSPTETKTNLELAQNITMNGASLGRHLTLGMAPFVTIAAANATYQYANLAMDAYQNWGGDEFSPGASFAYATANSAAVAIGVGAVGLAAAVPLSRHVFMPAIETATHYLVPQEAKDIAQDVKQLVLNLAPSVASNIGKLGRGAALLGNATYKSMRNTLIEVARQLEEEEAAKAATSSEKENEQSQTVTANKEMDHSNSRSRSKNSNVKSIDTHQTRGSRANTHR